MANKEIWDYLIENGIGCQVQTPYGAGTVVDVDAGAAIWVEPINETEEWETYQFDSSDLKKPIASQTEGENNGKE